MAFIRSNNISDMLVTKSAEERTFTHPSIHPAVTAMYRAKGYDTIPLSAEEAAARGLRDHNGLAVTAQEIRTSHIPDGEQLYVKLAPSRFFVRQAMVDHVAEHGVTDHDILGEMSPRIMGISIIAPIKLDGKYFIVGQIKGHTVGGGDIHAGYVAGGLRAKDLTADNPFLTALQHQVKDESGLSRDDLNLSSFKYLIDERETGQINLGAVARGFDFDYALTAFEKDTMTKLAANPTKKLEVNGFAPLRVDGLSIIPVENGRAGLANITCHFATPTGLDVRVKEGAAIRPYTEAWVTHFADKRNVARFLEYAGF